MSVPEGSIARDAFDGARAVLDASLLSSPRLPPSIDHVMPPAPRRSGGPPAPRRSGGPLPDLVSAPPGAGPIHEAGAALRSGRVSCRDLVQASLAAAAARNDELVGLVEVLADRALAEADRLDAELRDGRWRGPLHGIPVSVKDVIDVAGAPTRGGSDAYLDVPTHDAEGMRRLRAAGAIVVGKAATHEFALGVTSPQSRNPHDPTRIPGGSSGGSAVAVATGMGLGSLGTDTRASIRVPAALSGVVGLKPTYGRVPTDGVLTLSWTMDHVAPMAATVADAALLLDALDARPGTAWAPGGAPSWWDRAGAVGLDGLRVGLPDAAFAGADPGVAEAVAAGLAALEGAGCRLATARRPSAADLDVAEAAGLVVSRAEAATAHRSLGLDRSRYWPEVAEQLEEAEHLSALDYLQAQRLRRDLADALLGELGRHDVLAMPTVPTVAPPVEDFAEYLMVLARNAIPWSFVGFPAISVPCGTAPARAAGSGGRRLPVGLQLVAAPGREDLLLAAAAVVEAAS